MTLLIAFDLETERIEAGNISPPAICGSFATRGDDGELDARLYGNHPDDGLEDMVEWMLTDSDVRIVTQGGGYDYAVICRTWPRMIPLVYAKLIAGEATDTLWREKLLNLSTTGRLEKMEMPDGSKVRISYAMEALAEKYLGIDMSEVKGNIEESWRANYGTLDGWKAEDYPEEASEYSLNDARYTLRIHEGQEQRKAEWSMASTETEEFQLTKSFVLQLMSAWGMEVDPEATDEIEKATTKVMEENKDLLEASGILRGEGRVGPPYKKDEERAADLVRDTFGAEAYLAITDDTWGEYTDWLKDEHAVKFKAAKGKPGSINEAVLQDHLEALYKKLGEIPSMTDGGEKKEPAIKCDAEVHSYLATKCPVMAQYHERKALAKIVTQMIPVLRSGPVIYPSYNAIVETGRTSSFDGGKVRDSKTERNYPSVNIQQIPNLIKGLDVRRCFRPREGTVFFDVDFTGLELACVGHVTYGLFGKSVHRDLYNAGVDLHGYLGAQLGLNSDIPEATDEFPALPQMTRDFQSLIREEGISSDPMAVYDAFFLLKTHEDEDVRDFFSHFRSFAKPVGLGFPGGLGPETLIDFARKTYGVILTLEQATMFRDFWRTTYPEMPLFFDWVNAQTDEYNGSGEFYYVSDLGMVRRGATFCAEANGRVMQTPGAEAAMAGTILLSRACYDPTQESVLYGCRPIAFVHDQNIGETTRDESLWALQCEEAAYLMRQGAEMVLTSMTMRTDEALLTSVWTKKAKPVRDEAGVLQVWRP